MSGSCSRVYRLTLICGILLLTMLLAGCAGRMTMSTRYSPLHPTDNASVEFDVTAKDSDGIEKADLYVFEYELFLNNGMQSAQQRPGGTWGLVKTWNFPSNPTTIDEMHTVSGFPAKSYITYIIEVFDTNGNKKNEEWTFAAGTWPFGNSPIPLWSNGAPAERIDVAFVADNTDFTQARDMLDDLEYLIFDGYHINNGVKEGKVYWQFYYSPQLGFISDYDSGVLNMDIPSGIDNSSIIDHAAIIHTSVKRDWASGGNFGTEPINIGTAVHESGHAAFGLSDEYSGGGHRTSNDPHHNNFNSQSDCETYNTANGWEASDCENIEGSWWRPEPSSLKCIMHNDDDANMPDFERTCIRHVRWFYSELE